MADISGSGGSGGGGGGGGGSASDGGGGGGSKEPTLSNLEKLMNRYFTMYANYSFFGIPSPTNSNLRRFIKRFIGLIAKGNYMGALVTFNTMFYGEQADSLLITDNMGEFLLMWPLINAGMTYIQSRLPSESDSEEGSIFSMVATGALGTFETIDSTYGEMAQDYANTLSAVPNIVNVGGKRILSMKLVIPDRGAYLSYMKTLSSDDRNVHVAVVGLRNIEFILEAYDGDLTSLAHGDTQIIIQNFIRAARFAAKAATSSPIVGEGLRLYLQVLLAQLSEFAKEHPDILDPEYIKIMKKAFHKIPKLMQKSSDEREGSMSDVISQVGGFFTSIEFFTKFYSS